MLASLVNFRSTPLRGFRTCHPVRLLGLTQVTAAQPIDPSCKICYACRITSAHNPMALFHLCNSFVEGVQWTFRKAEKIGFDGSSPAHEGMAGPPSREKRRPLCVILGAILGAALLANDRRRKCTSLIRKPLLKRRLHFLMSAHHLAERTQVKVHAGRSHSNYRLADITS